MRIEGEDQGWFGAMRRLGKDATLEKIRLFEGFHAQPLTRDCRNVLSVLAFACARGRRTVTRQNANAFSQKVAQVRQQSEVDSRAARRTALTQDELNSWLAYRSQQHLPNGVSTPEVTIVGQGRMSGNAVVDLEAIGKRRSSGGTLDPWNLLGGQVPVTVAGILHTRDGMGRFEVQSAEIVRRCRCPRRSCRSCSATTREPRSGRRACGWTTRSRCPPASARSRWATARRWLFSNQVTSHKSQITSHN